jgi:hypothetical protein
MLCTVFEVTPNGHLFLKVTQMAIPHIMMMGAPRASLAFWYLSFMPRASLAFWYLSFITPRPLCNPLPTLEH